VTKEKHTHVREKRYDGKRLDRLHRGSLFTADADSKKKWKRSEKSGKKVSEGKGRPRSLYPEKIVYKKDRRRVLCQNPGPRANLTEMTSVKSTGRKGKNSALKKERSSKMKVSSAQKGRRVARPREKARNVGEDGKEIKTKPLWGRRGLVAKESLDLSETPRRSMGEVQKRVKEEPQNKLPSL